MFCIIKYNERFALKVPGVKQETWPRWGQIHAANIKTPNGPVLRARLKPITREDAQRLIRENGFVESMRTTDGVVFDTPDRSFQQGYAGHLDIPRNLGAE